MRARLESQMIQRRSVLASMAGAALASAALAVTGGRLAWSQPAGGVSAPSPVVRTRQGDLRGAGAGGVHVFKGIPYAAAPVGADSLRPPRPAEPWTGVREAISFGPKPPQQAMPPMVAEILPEVAGMGDNCLTLNLWSGDLAGRQPVVVWISGGLFEYHGTGASPWYDGTTFARDGVVCVTINYRVGASGFLYLGDGIANVGLLDQIAALEWVRENIAAFGGDADNVTVFGESAGALSVGTLLAMPRARGLFRRAIIESGGAHHVSSAETGLRIGRRLTELLGVSPTREAIAAVPIDRLLEAQGALRAELMSRPDPAFWGEVALTNLPWQPVVDGDTVPEPPIDAIRAGKGADVDLLVGSNREEWRLFMVADGSIERIPPEALMGTIAAFGLPVETGLAAYREMHPEVGTGELFAAVMTDWYWRIPALRLAEGYAARPRTGGTFMYELAWRSPRFGAAHSVEIPFVFDVLGPSTIPLLGEAPPQSLADAMHGAWVRFASTGDPGWPAYDLTRRATMRFDVETAVVDDPLAAERALWEGVR
jgi:carboxylesterase 2/para-nitrobenzyl esterase